ncbi:MAG TPA: hypothetical protein VFC46_16140 [Humisphaera sp.]|nr:hypothetical protein [Humisphaera sp.]
MDLVRALTAQEKPSLEFDPPRLALAGKMLVEKRARAAARAWPRLAESLGSKFIDEFATYSSRHPILEAVNAVTDGLHFIRFLDSDGRRPDDGHLEWLEYRARSHWIAFARLPRQRKSVVCIRLPWNLRLRFIRL